MISRNMERNLKRNNKTNSNFILEIVKLQSVHGSISKYLVSFSIVTIITSEMGRLGSLVKALLTFNHHLPTNTSKETNLDTMLELL